MTSINNSSSDHSDDDKTPSRCSPDKEPQAIGESADKPFGQPPRPRLGIGHIMLWTAGSAVILAIFRAAVDFTGMSGPNAWFWYVPVFFNSITYGAAVSAVVLFVYWRVTSGPAFPVQPGHWLLLITGVLGIANFLAYATSSLVADWSDAGPVSVMLGIQFFLPGAVGGVMSVVAAVRLIDVRYWQLYFWSKAIVHLLEATVCMSTFWLMGFLDALSIIHQGACVVGSLIVFIWLVVAIVLDWRRHAGRDWLHWTGIAVTLSGPFLYLIQVAWFSIISHFV